MAKQVAETPLMKQYGQMKRKHPDALLLFRVGDFYETFSDDAVQASEILGITLTRRANGKASHVELAGFPHHALDTYLPKLIRAGKRVAICEQLEDPKLTKKLVKRDITELITPGVNMNDAVLAKNRNNFLASLYFAKDEYHTGVALLDVSTGLFLCAQGSDKYVASLINTVQPSEILVVNQQKERARSLMRQPQNFTAQEDWMYTGEAAQTRLLQHFRTTTLKGFGITHMPQAIIAAGATLHYLDLTCHSHLSHIASLSRIDPKGYVHLDPFTIRNLELVASMSPQGKSLSDVIDRTRTPMGGRLLQRWILFPLRKRTEIETRHDVVEQLYRDDTRNSQLRDILTGIGDLDRLASKASAKRITPRELIQLRNALLQLPLLLQTATEVSGTPLHTLLKNLNLCDRLASRISKTLAEDAPALVSKGGYIAPGYDSTLDELRAISTGSKQYLDDLAQRLGAETGINSLKVSFNNVFGYYLEVRNTHRDKVPPDWIRRQTLVNAERYITPELKEYEQKILTAQSRIDEIESRHLADLIDEVGNEAPHILSASSLVAETDVLSGFASLALEENYQRPTLQDVPGIDITQGRHPVIEKMLPPGEAYVPNSVHLDPDHTQILMLTGPNMSGKSALLRQTALIVLMAQIGCFVPAQATTLGVVDKIFTRVGATDNISQGESTFMVEMNEAASIMNNITSSSLVLFDELGRGTSTYDGISIAWAIVEHLHQGQFAKPLTLFATHYHELNQMADKYPHIGNFHIDTQEVGGKIIFTRRLRKGGSEHSFGIHVAQLAGLPPHVVNRANEILTQLEGDRKQPGTAAESLKKVNDNAGQDSQMKFFQLDDPLLESIRDRLLGLDIDNLTPLEGLQTLHALKSLLTGK